MCFEEVRPVFMYYCVVLFCLNGVLCCFQLYCSHTTRNVNMCMLPTLVHFERVRPLHVCMVDCVKGILWCFQHYFNYITATAHCILCTFVSWIHQYLAGALKCLAQWLSHQTDPEVPCQMTFPPKPDSSMANWTQDRLITIFYPTPCPLTKQSRVWTNV